jgi:AcrR family transcriptional regulator
VKTSRGPRKTAAQTRRDRERTGREEDVLRTAERVFTRRGYHAASMAEIAREAGYAVGSLYKFFDSKDALFLRLLDERIARLDAVVAAALASATSAPAQLEAVALATAGHCARERAFLSLFVSSIPGAFETLGLDAPSCRDHIERTHALLRAVIERGQEHREFTKTLRAEVILTAFEAATRAYNLEQVIKQEGNPDEREVRTLVRALLRGFAP